MLERFCEMWLVLNCEDIEQVWLNWKMCSFGILDTCIPNKNIISKKFQNGKCITREIKLLKRKEYRLCKYFKSKRVNLVYTEDDIFYEHEIYKELLSLDDSKTWGPDGIKPKFLKISAGQLFYPLCRLYNLSFNCGKLPTDWRIAHIASVHKKGSKLDHANYRHVSLTSIICKIMEKLIRKRLINHLDKNNFIVDNQHGFRSKHSCETQTARIHPWLV